MKIFTITAEIEVYSDDPAKAIERAQRYMDDGSVIMSGGDSWGFVGEPRAHPEQPAADIATRDDHAPSQAGPMNGDELEHGGFVWQIEDRIHDGDAWILTARRVRESS